MERNTGPVNTILIGSRAWNKNFAASNETDWDLIVTENQLEEILARRSFYHYRPHLEYGKLSVVHQGGAKLEFEVMEKLTSDQILKSLAKERKETIMLQNQVKEVYHNHTVPVTWPVQANIPSKEALLTLKASHIYFPINWRKNFLQLVSMMSSFAKSFSKVIKEDPHSSLLKELFQTRARETLHRVKSQVYLSVQRIHAPSVDQLCDSCKGVYDIEFKFKEIVQTKEDPSDTFYLPTTGLKLSKSDWLKLGTDKCHCEDDETDIKSSIICEQLILLALYYYLPQQRNFGFLSNLKKEDQINELFMLCIETFVTQQLVPVTRVTDHHTEFTSCLPMTGADIMAEVEASNIFEPAPLASNSELLKTTFANPIINWLIDSLSTHYEALRTSFAEFMIKTQRAREELFVHTLNAIPNLPFEVIEMIKSSAPNDHVLLSKLCRVCKSWNKYFSEEAKWKPLCDRFDKNTRELAEKHIKSARRRVAAKTMFRECYEMMSTAHTMNYCKHCRDLHERCSGYNVTSIRFEREGRCACPQCNAGSGQICPYYNDFLFSNEH